jgi:methyltransferase (TIGR00027 family)
MRAAHLLHDPPPWILEDRVARALLGDQYIAAVDAATADWTPRVFAAFRAHFATRSRLAEDLVIQGLDARQLDYVILGAGADSFAWRHRRAHECAIWEIDHPATQAWKQRALERLELGVPPNVRFVPVDLTTTSLREIRLPRRATWNWLGVTQYLERDATEATLEVIGSCGEGTTLVVEFLLTAPHCDALGVAFRDRSILVAEQAGEPMISFYEPADIEHMLRRAGFRTIELLDAHALSDRYLAEGSALQLPGAAIFAIART